MDKALALKLLAVQKDMKPIIKDETNQFFKSKYFDVNGLIAMLRPVLNQHGLVVLQVLDDIQGKPALNTQVIDSGSGEVHGYSTPLPVIDDVQKMGSAITYYRRYALASLFLLEAEDDDGESAKTQPSAPQAKPAPTAPAGSLGNCKDCGAPNKLSQKGSKFCSNKCWLNPTPQLPVIQQPKAPQAPTGAIDSHGEDGFSDLPF